MSATRQLEDAIFYAAQSVSDAEQRRLFIEQACGGNRELWKTVEELLAAQNEAERFFNKSIAGVSLPEALSAPEPPAAGATAGPELPPADAQIGSRIDHFKILERLGEGGCGVVYLAEQEEPVRRRVALKIIKLGMDTKNVIARFEAERQALAMMDHPNIARVLDAGATDTGRPYFVMELVRGIRITEYCDQNNFDTRQRLNLFIQVCHAIQHAHQKGIIHRDIKPSNILVTMHDGVPVPKVIDFGIAKATDTRLTDKTLFTAYEQLIGTPAYMSPEQAEMSGLDVDTRSDIYSLGVLLYELLTGRTPFDQKELMQSGLDEMRRMLREEEPHRPSAKLNTLHGTELTRTAIQRHVEPPKLKSLLKGDLDWIVMKALEKDRTRRYETANGLAVDIERYLNNEPILARPPSKLYRLRKLVRRNKAVFVSGASVLAALVIGLGLSTWLFFREREARHEQDRLRQQAEAREKITQAAVYVSQGRIEEADRLLDEVKTPPPRPSFDGVAAYRWVGEQDALKDLRESGASRDYLARAADRYTALMKIDELDRWPQVTLDYQSAGVVLAELGDRERYDRFREAAVAKFAGSTNGDAAGRILKTCLIMPAEPSLMKQLEPLGIAAEAFLAEKDPQTFPGWAAIPVCLWRYRTGDCAKVEEWCRHGLNQQDTTSAQYATLRLVLAMARWQSGARDEAQAELRRSREIIEARFRDSLDPGSPGLGYWYDWVFARLLLNEAAGLVDR